MIAPLGRQSSKITFFKIKIPKELVFLTIGISKNKIFVLLLLSRKENTPCMGVFMNLKHKEKGDDYPFFLSSFLLLTFFLYIFLSLWQSLRSHPHPHPHPFTYHSLSTIRKWRTKTKKEKEKGNWELSLGEGKEKGPRRCQRRL